MILEAKDIQNNWVQFLSNIDAHITGERKQKLLDFYKQYEERVMLFPSHDLLLLQPIDHIV